ncbi:YEATS domain-containing protein 2-like [Galendromus occidentalis]|uniref:YEATS domain-containing protein 2-like n=1 Tax=Galendromus occidentalis TaxID=34638 RepID=A0AAJ7SG31_9ACAR|nr:YEATS domain-containing protein 2-like [Galendromus occidentalis]
MSEDPESMDPETETKVRAIIEKQFEQEILSKQSEVELINERIYLTKQVLNRLRIAIIAKYFATPELADDEKTWSSDLDNCIHPTVRSYFAGKTPREPRTKSESEVRATYDLPEKLSTATLLKEEPVARRPTVKSLQSVRFIIGNVSKYIGRDDPENRVTHLWMTYVRLHPDSKEKIEELVSKVRFFLHPSYAPHDVIEVAYPFHLKRKGWGEFQLRAQIHFIDPLNKPADVLHELKLDQHKRGIQTNGGETHLEVKLLVEKPLDSPVTKNPEQPEPGSISIKQEVLDNDENSVFDETHHPEPDHFDLEAHGHDYCFTPISSGAPFLLVASGSAMLRDNPPGVRIMKGESLLKNRSFQHNAQTAQIVTPWQEAVLEWEQALKSLDFSRPVMKVVETLASRLFKLVGDKAVGDLSFQVSSIEEFIEFPLAKQRAIEWFRASHIRRVLRKNGVGELPSTRAIVVHLRKHGFTPLHDGTEMIGVPIEQKFESLSVAELPNGVESLEVSSIREKTETLCEIDILGSDSDDEAPSSKNQVGAPLLRFIHDAMKEISDEPNLSEDRKELEETLRTLFGALRSFSSDLLRKSLAQSFARNSSTHQVDGILPSDIHEAITSHELFDFLSNDGLGTISEKQPGTT